MKKLAEKQFAKRVHVILGCALILGVCASLAIEPSCSVETKRELVQSAVLARTAPVEAETPPAPSVGTQRSVSAQSAPTQTVRLDKLAPKQRLVAWFTEYDRIRREAQMTPAEKATAIKLWATSYVASDHDKQEARSILSSLVKKYERAEKELAALPKIPETDRLQRGYLGYFQKARADFSSYLATLESRSTQAALSQMQEGRQDLAEIDVRNKSLDRNLRRQYQISEFQS